MCSRIETAVLVDWPDDLDPRADGPLWATVRYRSAEEREPGTASVVIVVSATRPQSPPYKRRRTRGWPEAKAARAA